MNGVRPVQEFSFGGEFRPMPDPNSASDEDWGGYVFYRSGEPSVKKEWWCHIASGVWFIAERDTLKDEFIRTYLYDESESDG